MTPVEKKRRIGFDDPMGIYGAGGHGREVRWLAEELGYHAVSFLDDRAVADQELAGIPVVSPKEFAARFPGVPVTMAIGSPSGRESATGTAKSLGFELATLVHPSVMRSERVTIGEATVVFAGSILTTDVTIGRNVQINLACTVSHDVVIDDYCTLASGVHIAGAVSVGRRAFIGSGAVIINGTAEQPLRIGHDAVIGAGACVTSEVQPQTTVVGVPARPLGG